MIRGNAGNRSVVHLDLDTFFVSVERLVNSKLEGKPVIIGGMSDRGVVASCSYEARTYGVHSAMPMKMARMLCADAIFIRGDMELYSRYSHTVSDIIAEKAPLYEKASVDEFYIDVTGLDRFFGCLKWTHELRESVIKNTGLLRTVSEQDRFKDCHRRSQAQRRKGSPAAHRAPVPASPVDQQDPHDRGKDLSPASFHGNSHHRYIEPDTSRND